MASFEFINIRGLNDSDRALGSVVVYLRKQTLRKALLITQASLLFVGGTSLNPKPWVLTSNGQPWMKGVSSPGKPYWESLGTGPRRV